MVYSFAAGEILLENWMKFRGNLKHPGSRDIPTLSTLCVDRLSTQKIESVDLADIPDDIAEKITDKRREMSRCLGGSNVDLTLVPRLFTTPDLGPVLELWDFNYHPEFEEFMEGHANV